MSSLILIPTSKRHRALVDFAKTLSENPFQYVYPLKSLQFSVECVALNKKTPIISAHGSAFTSHQCNSGPKKKNLTNFTDKQNSMLLYSIFGQTHAHTLIVFPAD